MARARRSDGGEGTRVSDTLHVGDTRANIPTQELQSFVAADDGSRGPLLYPRDTSLDPQLVWKGKDEQDASPLAVAVVPVHIQEHIRPKALIEDLRAVSASRREAQLDLFADFDGMPFEERVEFYQHPMRWSNRLILGNSLHVMTSLAEKEGLKGQVQMIYVDPPYGIRFGSNWQVSTRKRDVKDGKIDDATRQPEQIRAFRDTWELGIHSYLSYLRDRFTVARDLLTESGSIFVQIGDENLHLVRSVLDEVFGSANFISSITFRKTAGATSEYLPPTADYVHWYARDRDRLRYRHIYRRKGFGESGAGAYDSVELADGSRKRLTDGERSGAVELPGGARAYRHQILTSPRVREARTGYYPVSLNGRDYLPSTGSGRPTRTA